MTAQNSENFIFFEEEEKLTRNLSKTLFVILCLSLVCYLPVVRTAPYRVFPEVSSVQQLPPVT